MIRKERKKGPVWEHFNSGNKNDDSHPHVQCKYCSKAFQRAVPERMQTHLDKKCPKAPINSKSQSVQKNATSIYIIDHIGHTNEEMLRKKKPVWENFNVIGKYDDSHPHVQCKYCYKEFKRAVPQRMQVHIENCLEASNNAKLQSKIQNTTSTIDNINDHMSEDEQKFLESLLAKALSSAEIPSSFVDNPLVIQFFKRLQPSFKLPNGEQIKMQMNDNSDQLRSLNNNNNTCNDENLKINYYKVSQHLKLFDVETAT
ncbi:7270_t:CDS:2 [Rhizophagus irregularis]|nr:7270_t:CDS:2 [Rhizophagus irregularis]